MKWKLKYNAFSTVETIVASVILSMLLVVFYSAIGSTLDADHSVLIARGINASENWKSGFCENDAESADFPGGKLFVDRNELQRNLILLHFTIKDRENTKLLEWEEYTTACEN